MATYSIPLTRSLNKHFVHRNVVAIVVGLFLILLLLVIVFMYIFFKGSPYSEKHFYSRYEHCPQLKEGKINIHVLAHTHDDVAWLKTFDQYYYGTKSTVHNAGVQYILDSVVDQLLQDENRRFVYVEIAFFWRWWKEQSPERQSQIKKLVNAGQLEFAGGAWSMNDEAITSYDSIIDNFSWGLRKITEMFGDSIMARPKVGWQIDPFGHSREQASIFAQLGFDGAFLNRIDYHDKAARMKSKNAEFVWRASPNLGKVSNIFCTILYNHYSPVKGFHFGYHHDENDAIVDEYGNPEYNIDRKVSDLLNEVRIRSQLYNTSNIYLTWGDDFTFQRAGVWFKNFDKIIRNINTNSEEFNIFYSTPGCYIKSVNDDKNLLLSTKEDDFFPYVQKGYSYWNGYYTSRPTLKYFIRFASNFLQICKQLMVLADVDENYNNGALDEFRSVIGLMQHHDAITGTSKMVVVEDYKLRIAKSIENSGVVVDHAIKKLLSKENNDANTSQNNSLKFTSCLRTNITECSTSESGKPFIITLYNPLSRPATHFVRLPVLGDGLVSYKVLNSQSEQELVQLVPIPEPVKSIPGRKSNSTFELVFKAENIPPLGFRSYYIAPTNDPEKVYSSKEMPSANLYTIGDINRTAITVDGGTNQIKSGFFYGRLYPFQQSYLYYASKDHPDREKPSGAYIFNPYDDEPKLISTYKPETKVFTGVHVDEIHQKFNNWASQVIRIYKDENHVEFEWLVGPLGVSEDLIGKEVIVRYKMPQLNNNDSFYTDCNGREMIRRIKNKRDTWSVNIGNSTVPGNYYPITSRIMIRDGEIQLSVMPDRPEGGTSFHDGEIELMIHRESLFDDELGVGESLIETEFNKEIVVRGKHYLTVGNINRQNAYDRLLIERKQNHVWMFFTQINDTTFSTWNDIFKTEYSGLRSSLPNNVKILTIEPWLEGEFLLRLEHFIEKSDHIDFSKIAIVDLQNLFMPFTINSVREMTLGADIKLGDKERLKWSASTSSSSGNESLHNSSNKNTSNDKEINWEQIILYPMEIRTFIVNVSFKS